MFERSLGKYPRCAIIVLILWSSLFNSSAYLACQSKLHCSNHNSPYPFWCFSIGSILISITARLVQAFTKRTDRPYAIAFRFLAATSSISEARSERSHLVNQHTGMVHKRHVSAWLGGYLHRPSCCVRSRAVKRVGRVGQIHGHVIYFLFRGSINASQRRK